MPSCPIPNPRRAAAVVVGAIVVSVLAALTWPRPAQAWGLGSMIEHAAVYTAAGVAAHEAEHAIDRHREETRRESSYGSQSDTAPARASQPAAGTVSSGVYVEPMAGVSPVTAVINSARQSVDLNVYYLSSRPVLDALRSAVQRGVQVRVILDQKPYGIHNDLVIREANNVQATGAALHWAPMRFERRAFDHAKYVCSESSCEIGTANFDPSAFSRNREYLAVTQDPAVVANARAVFEADWNGHKAGDGPRRHLVLSPGAQPSLLWLIRQPGPVDIETEELGNARDILEALAQRGASVRLILPDSISAANRRNAQGLAQRGVQIRLMPRRIAYMHAKIILTPQAAFLGSQNFSDTSLERNREMGLLLAPGNAGALRSQFEKDWQMAQPMG